MSKVLASTEDTWNEVFRASGRQYEEPKLVLFSGVTPTAWPPTPERWLNRLAQRSEALHARLQVPLGTSWEGGPMPQPRFFDSGISAKSFDGRGNFSMGVSEQIIFPEIDYDKIDALRGLDITLTTTARSDDEGRALLRAFNFPFRN